METAIRGAIDTAWPLHLDRFADRVALVTDEGLTLSYADLLTRADALAAAEFPPARSLVALAVTNDVDSIAAYLGALRAGHAVLLLAAGQSHDALLQRFRPAVFRDASMGLIQRLDDSPALHPDLMVLLSTSGSTGSPKLVRLSALAVAANAASIIQYLGLDQSERAVTTLPFHYSYGLSVLHSHLMAGASLALTDLSVTHPDFEPFLGSARPTSLAGVPYTYELLARTGLDQRLPASIRTLTQAGGRLPPERLEALLALGEARGFRVFAMYGQTEATARMAYLPPDLAARHPDCIGIPIPGGAFRLIDADGETIREAGQPGELVYDGPNVMMGYATEAEDLVRSASLAELRTGDIAERTPSGLYRIVGRASRFAKIAGLRIGFDDVEALARQFGTPAIATGSDRLITLHAEPLETAAERADLRRRIAERIRVPEAQIVVTSGPTPLLPSGKVDYGAIRRAGEAAADAEARAMTAGGVHPILAGYRRAFNRPNLGPDASFQSLGGDSLAYVNAAMAIEQVLGQLPERWEEMPVAALIALAPAASADQPVAPPSRVTVGSDTLVRLFALALVIIGHGAPAETPFLRGGANILFLLAGFSFARFGRSGLERGQWRPLLGGTLERMILPYYLLMVPLLLVSKAEASWGWYALVSVFTVEFRGPLFAFWFIETVFHALLVMLLLYALPGVRRASAANPFRFGLALLALAVAARAFVPAFLFDDVHPISLTLDNWFYLYALGFLAAVASGWRQMILVMALGLVLAGWAHGLGSSRQLWLAAGLAVILFLPTLRVPRLAARFLMAVGAASYFIYMAHVLADDAIERVWRMPDNPLAAIALLLAVSVVAGLVGERLWSLIISRASRLLSGRAGQGSPRT